MTANAIQSNYGKKFPDSALKIVAGECGHRCKREIFRVQYALSKLKKAARNLLALEESDPKRILEGAVLLKRMSRNGLLADDELELDCILQLSTQKLLKRHIRVATRLSSLPISSNARVLPSRTQHITFINSPPFKEGITGHVTKKLVASNVVDKDDQE